MKHGRTISGSAARIGLACTAASPLLRRFSVHPDTLLPLVGSGLGFNGRRQHRATKVGSRSSISSRMPRNRSRGTAASAIWKMAYRACRAALAPIARNCGETKRFVGSRQSSSPTSEVRTDPRNWRVNLRSKSRLRTPAFDSPVGFAMPASFGPQ